MSRLPIRSMFMLAVLLSGTAQASDITPEQAKQIETNLKSILPKGMIPNGAIAVRAEGDAYQVTINPMELFSLGKNKKIKISGLTPWVHRLRPTENGLWQMDQQTSLDIKAQIPSAAGATNLEYGIGSFQYNGIFDPAIRYAQSADFTAQNLRVKSTSPTESFDATLGSVSYSLKSEKGENNTINIQTSTAMSDYAQTMRSPNKPEVLFRAGSGKGSGTLTGVALQPLQEMAYLLLQNVPKKHIRTEDKERIAALFRNNLPLFGNISQSVSYQDVTIDAGPIELAVKNYAVDVKADGIRNNASYAMGVHIAGLKLPPGLVSPAFNPLLPEDVDINIAASGIDAQNGVVYVMDNVDFDPDHSLTPPQTAEIRRQFFPENTLTISYDGTHAASSFYDVTVTGKTIIALTGQDKPVADVTIHAKDLDKTIDYLQTHAKDEPQLGQAAFFMLMAKGFAKTDPNGGYIWHIESDSAGQIKLNGHDFDLPGAPAAPTTPKQ